jgi:hypothetical protein
MLAVAEKYAGRNGQCPSCGQPAQVPFLASPPSVSEHALTVEAVEEEIPEVLPAYPVAEIVPEPCLDGAGRFWLWSCDHCERPLRTPIRESGKIIDCPTCRLFLRAPGKRKGRSTGLPVALSVSAVHIVWPLKCVCCLDQHDTFVAITAIRVDWSRASSLLGLLASTETNGWRVPFCWDCVAHNRRNDESRCKRSCAFVSQAVVYDGWHGATHRFRFYNWRYANLFVSMNRDKMLI